MKNKLTIGPLSPQRLSEAAEIERLCFSSPWSAGQLAESISLPGSHCLEAVLDGRLAGYIGFYRVLDEGFVTNLAVRPDLRRKGVGRALLRRLISDCADLGVRAVSLEVRESNAPALALYLSEGFTVDGRRPRFYSRPTEDALLLSRGL